MVPPILVLLRPKHWVKNILVFAALFFSFSFTVPAIALTASVFVAFSLLASTVYVINDIADAERDSHHPTKKNRPIASGAVAKSTAAIVASALFAISVWWLYSIGSYVAYIGLLYFGINILYSFGLKHVAILDVIIVAIGFLLRVIIGAVAINVPVSHWIVLCTFFLALFVAFGKRRHEMVLLGEDGKSQHRQSMREYTNGFIDQMLGLSAGVAVVFYSLYTIDTNTVLRFGSDDLIYTTPIVVFGVLRYFYLLYNRDSGGDPVQLMTRDRQLQLAVIIWLVTVWLIYHNPVQLI